MIPTADRDFKGVWIPKEVWLDNRLSMLDKGILAEIDSLDLGDDGCFASNEHLAEFCQCSERKVTESISKLIDLGYVWVSSFDGRKRFLRSRVAKSASQGSKNCEADSQKVRDSNTPNKPTTKTNKSLLSDTDFLGFIEFWKIYPNKVKKSSAISSWKSGKCEKIADTIIADVQRRCETEWKGQEMQFIPHPTTYLHQRRWEDETAPKERQPVGHSQGWHNPALDYAQRDYSGTKPKPERVYMTFDEEG